jgi:branched-subunit amino acid transport protein
MTPTVWAIVVAGGLATFAVRFSALAVAHWAGEVPPKVREALRMIPPAALAALVAPAVLRAGGQIDLLDPRLPAAGLALLVMWRTRSVVLMLAVGLGTLVALQQLL